MDASNPAPLVNGELLRRCSGGGRVRCAVKVSRLEAGGSVVTGVTADNQPVTVRCAAGGAAISPQDVVEVIGIVENDKSIRAELCTNFGAAFDMVTHNQLCQMANGEYRALFV